MSLVRLLGFSTLACGCVVGRYREVATSREVAYVEEKGNSCAAHGHRRNHTVTADRVLVPQPALAMSRTALPLTDKNPSGLAFFVAADPLLLSPRHNNHV